MTCRLCDNPAGWIGYDGDPTDPLTDSFPVCGLHMVVGLDDPIVAID